jgi:hypothetical protein
MAPSHAPSNHVVGKILHWKVLVKRTSQVVNVEQKYIPAHPIHVWKIRATERSSLFPSLTMILEFSFQKWVQWYWIISCEVSSRPCAGCIICTSNGPALKDTSISTKGPCHGHFPIANDEVSIHSKWLYKSFGFCCFDQQIKAVAVSMVETLTSFVILLELSTIESKVSCPIACMCAMQGSMFASLSVKIVFEDLKNGAEASKDAHCRESRYQSHCRMEPRWV